MIKTPLEKLDDVTAIAISPGNVDVDDYMRGMANGLLLAQHIMHNKNGNVEYFRADGTRDPAIQSEI